MVTLGFVLVFILLGQLMVVIDMVLYQYSYFDAYSTIYYSQSSTDRFILFSSVFFGFCWSLMTDLRRKKSQKKSGKQSAGGKF